MGEWGRDNGWDLWEGGEEFEGGKGWSYGEVEMGVGGEVRGEEGVEVVEDFVGEEGGEGEGWSFGVENGKGRIEGGEEGDGDMMMREGVNDGIEGRGEEYLGGYKGRYGEGGGGKKDWGKVRGSEEKEELGELGKGWEVKEKEDMRKDGFERGLIEWGRVKEEGIEGGGEVDVGFEGGGGVDDGEGDEMMEKGCEGEYWGDVEEGGRVGDEMGEWVESGVREDEVVRRVEDDVGGEDGFEMRERVRREKGSEGEGVK